MRRTLRSSPNALTRKTTSTFAATTCSTSWSPAALRENAVARSSTAWIVAASASGASSTATQSPTAGKSDAVAAS